MARSGAKRRFRNRGEGLRHVKRLATCAPLSAIFTLLLLPALARASTSGSFYLPLGVPQQTYAGLIIKVDTDWAQGYGYRPVRLELLATQPSNEDRSLTVEVSLNDYSNRSVISSTVLKLPSGSRNVVEWVAVPQLANDQMISLRTFAGGRQIEELSTERFSIGSGQYWPVDSGIPRALFVADSPPDVSGFKFFGAPPYTPYGNVTFGKPQDVGSFAYLKAADLFDESIYYSALDMMFMSRTEATNLLKRYSKTDRVWEAINDWVRAGGVLVLFGVNHDDADLADVERLLSFQATEQQATQPNRGWTSPTADVFEQKVLAAAEVARAAAEAEALANGVLVPQEQPTGDEASDAGVSESGAADAETSNAKQNPEAGEDAEAPAAEVPFLWRPVGMGYVVAWRNPKPFPGDELDWRWLMTSLPDSCTRWTLRHGAAPDEENPQFNELLIADVGLPPIQTYKVLITIFVVLIGPVNYWLLRRFERLHLFLFTVPLAALVVTGGLLGYALMADGLESRLRSRSLTILDQRAGQAATSARLSYYVGFTPGGGLTFPRETVVTPLELEPAYYLTGNARRRIAWDLEQHLTRGWLPARTPMQLVTDRAYSCQRSLQLGMPATDGSREVANNLGVHVHELLVCDENGKLLSAQGLHAGSQGPLNVLSADEQKTEATLRFLKTFDQHAPAIPTGMDPYGSQGTWRFFGMGRTYYGGQKQVGFAKTGLEARLDELRSTISAGTLEPRSYVAIVDRPAEVSVGLSDLTESQSTHVIHGVW